MFTVESNLSNSTSDTDLPDNASGIGIILCNLGSPTSYYPKSIRKFLAEFLTDSRVIESPPRWIWWFVLHFLILQIRPNKLVHRYQSIWLEQGSPLQVYTKQQASKLALALEKERIHVLVDYAFRYGAPNMAQRLTEFKQLGIDKILVIPMYPQYSATTTASVNDAVYLWGLRQRNLPEIRVVRSFPDHPLFIKALANKVTKYWQQNGSADVLVLSFHGLPQSYINRGDPYVKECTLTYNALKQQLKLTDAQCTMSFQSRFGPSQWTQPYTVDTVAKLSAQNLTVDVIAPAFMVDCIETLDEIQNEIRMVYQAEGGKRYRYIPCLNADDDLINLLQELTKQQLSGWQ